MSKTMARGHIFLGESESVEEDEDHPNATLRGSHRQMVTQLTSQLLVFVFRGSTCSN